MTALDERTATATRDELRDAMTELSAELRDGVVDESHVTACMRDYRPGLSAVGLWVLWLGLDDAIRRLDWIRGDNYCPSNGNRRDLEDAASDQLEYNIDRLTGMRQ